MLERGYALVALALVLAVAAAEQVGGPQPATGGPPTPLAKPPPSARYQFYRQLEGQHGAAGTRRVFGGQLANVAEYPAICALLDRYWRVKCSGAVLTSRWVVTAGHCVTPRVAYVKYDTNRPTSTAGRVAPVLYLYRHPKYAVVWKDEGRGMDVTGLTHDMGLVRVRSDIRLPRLRAFSDSIRTMRRYNPVDMHDKDIKVMGFGRTDDASVSEELFAVPLRMVFCERASWVHCVCGQARRQEGRTRGVCTGDSGGPVLFEGVQVAVTSMGPVECASRQGPPDAATSVFTSLYEYADLINSTILDTDAALRMNQIAVDMAHSRRAARALLAALLVLPAFVL